MQSHGITDVTKRNERLLLLPSESVSKSGLIFPRTAFHGVVSIVGFSRIME